MSAKDHLYRQLIQLGDMMGDGLHYEPDGKWIPKEYKRVLKALGIIPKRRPSSTSQINDLMRERVAESKCRCGGKVKQTRSGSMRAVCVECGNKYQLLKRCKKRAA